MKKNMDRRLFVALATATFAARGLAGAAPMSSPLIGEARKPTNSGDDNLIINALGQLGNPNPQPSDQVPTKSHPTPVTESASVEERVIREAHASGLTAVTLTLGYTAGAMEPFEFTLRDVAQLDALIRANSRDLVKIFTTADILRAKAEGKIGLIYGFQNAAMVGNDATRVDTFANLGVRVIQLTYNPANQIGDGSVAPENRGLTKFGHEVVERLNDQRVMVDLSHSGQNTCLDAARASKQAVSINHTGCRALNDLPRNKSDEEIRLVAIKGGFIGIYFMPFLNPTGHATAMDVVSHIDHAVNVCGEDHVGIGTDGSVTSIDDLSAYKDTLALEVAARQAAGVSAAGERADTYPFVTDLRGVEQFRHLADLLQKRGYTTARVEKILGRNYFRYAKDVWGA